MSDAPSATGRPDLAGRISDAARRRRRAVLTIAARRPFSIENVWREFLTDELLVVQQTEPEKAEKKAREKARVYLNGLVSAERLVELGEVQLNEWGGRKRKMFASPSLQVNRGWLMHDTMLWEWLDKLPNAQVIAGYDDRLKFNQDGRVTFSNGRIGNIEMDTESESLATVLLKFEENYKGKIRVADPRREEKQTEFVLFATLSEARIEKLKDRLRDKEAAWYTLFANWFDLMRGEQKWETIAGKKVTLYPAGG